MYFTMFLNKDDDDDCDDDDDDDDEVLLTVFYSWLPYIEVARSHIKSYRTLLKNIFWGLLKTENDCNSVLRNIQKRFSDKAYKSFPGSVYRMSRHR